MKTVNNLNNLVKKAKKQNGDALAKIYDEFLPRVFRYIYYQVNDRAIAEDLTSDTFLKMLTAIKDFREDGKSFYPWLLRIAKNTTYDYLRVKAKRSYVVFDEDVEELLFDKRNAIDLEYTVMASIDAEEVRRAVAELTEDQQQVLLLRFMMGLTNVETANVLDKTEGSVKALQVRALASLRRKIESSGRVEERIEPTVQQSSKSSNSRIFRQA